MINVLVTGTGGGVGQSIIKALRSSRIDCRIITSDSNPLAAGIYRGDVGHLVPPSSSPDFIDTVIGICQKEDIDIILIGSDPELPPFSANRRRIEEETDSKVVVSSPETIRIAYDKWYTYEFLKENNLAYPRSALPERMHDLLDEVDFPVIIKPRTGSASVDVRVARDEEELKFLVERTDNPIIQEYLRPAEEEYTSGVVVFNGELLGVITMKRELKGGSTYRAFIDNYDNVKDEVIKAAKAFMPFGPSNFQMRVTERGPVTFEINPRFSGTTALRAYVGFNEPEAVINYVLNGKLSNLSYKKGMVAMRYWNEIFIPYDEYLKLRNQHRIEDSASQVNQVF